MALRKKQKTIWKTACHRTFWHNPFKSLQKSEFAYVCKHIGFPALAVFPFPSPQLLLLWGPQISQCIQASSHRSTRSTRSRKPSFGKTRGEIFWMFWGVGNIHENMSEKNWKHTFFWVRKEFRRVLPLLHGFERCPLPFTNVVEVPSDDGYINPVTPVV